MTPIQFFLWAGVAPLLIIIGMGCIFVAIAYGTPWERRVDWPLIGAGALSIIVGIVICYFVGHIQAGLPW